MGSQHNRPDKTPTGDAPDERGRYALKPEWIRTETVINVGLIVLGVYILQAFMSTGANDVAARVAIVAWAAAIPQLAFLALLNQVQAAFRYFSYPWYFAVPRSVAYVAAVVGFAAALWRLWIPGSLVLIASGAVGLLVYSFAYGRLERDNAADRN